MIKKTDVTVDFTVKDVRRSKIAKRHDIPLNEFIKNMNGILEKMNMEGIRIIKERKK